MTMGYQAGRRYHHDACRKNAQAGHGAPKSLAHSRRGLVGAGDSVAEIARQELNQPRIGRCPKQASGAGEKPRNQRDLKERSFDVFGPRSSGAS